MAVKKGYKQTEVGVIPEDWEVGNLHDVLDPSRPVRYGVVQPGEFVLRGQLMLRSQDYSKGWTGPDEMHRISSALEKQYRNARISSGDLIMTIVGAGIGQVVFAPRWLDAAILSRSTGRVAVDPQKAASRYIAAFLESPFGKKQILDCQKEGAQPVVSCPDLARFRIPLPTLAEQEAIAGALSDADAWIESLEQLIAKKRLIKQGAMQELLTGKRRLPGFSGEWETKRLGDVAPIQRGFDLPNSRLIPGPYPVVYSNGVLNHHGAHQVPGPGVVTGRSGTIGRVTFVEGPFWPHNTTLWVTSFKGNFPKFVFYLFSAIGFERFASGSGVPTLNRGDVHSHFLRVPSDVAEQTAIAIVLSDMDAEIESLEVQLAKAREIKQGMMQELLTGRIRLVS